MTSIRIEINKKEEPRQFYRVPHDIERINWNLKDLRYGGDGYKLGTVRGIVDDTGDPMPEVYRTYPDHQVVIDCAWQGLWRNMNPKLSNQKWSTLLGNKFAFTNWSGFPGHKNCITGADADKPLPRFDAHRLTGGAIITGYEQDGKLFIETMRNTDSPPALDVLIRKPWLWFYATSVNKQGEPNFIPRQGLDGNYYSVVIPILTAKQVWLPLDELDKLPLGQPIPDATWLA